MNRNRQQSTAINKKIKQKLKGKCIQPGKEIGVNAQQLKLIK